MTQDSPFISIEGVTMSFGGVQALRDVSIAFQRGVVHALVGENGAGKSTLIKVMSGIHKPSHGLVRVDGQPIRLGSVAASEAAGIAVIHQESTAFPDLDAVDNLFAGHEPRRARVWLDRRRMVTETRAMLKRLGVSIDLKTPVGELPLAQQQMVAIGRALNLRSRLLIMDEPTASLSNREIDVLFDIIRRLVEDGIGIVYVSHRLEEVFQLSQMVTVLRDGTHVHTGPTEQLNRASLIRLMVGRELEAAETGPQSVEPGPAREPVLTCSHLQRAGVVHDVSFTVHAGEIVGLAGLVGAGRSEVARCIFGVDRRDSGEVLVKGQPVPPGDVSQAIQAGIALVPEDRQHQGLILPMSVETNLVIVVQQMLARWIWRNRRRERDVASAAMQALQVKAASGDVEASTLSGGNQQKLVLGKWLAADPAVLILDEPTRGVDVGARTEVYRLIRAQAAEGRATLVISSDLPELLQLCDRLLVMRAGRIAGELNRSDATQERVLELALAPGDAA